MSRIAPTVRRARRFYGCMTKAAPWCTGIRAGDRHWVHVLPPGSDIGNERWWRSRECAACADWYGRPIPEVAA